MENAKMTLIKELVGDYITGQHKANRKDYFQARYGIEPRQAEWYNGSGGVSAGPYMGQLSFGENSPDRMSGVSASLKIYEAQTKATKQLVQGDYTYNFAQSAMIKDEIIGKSFVTRSGKVIEVTEHVNTFNNLIFRVGNEYDACAGVWFISHVERGSFVKS
jgi:hypothetical protein